MSTISSIGTMVASSAGDFGGYTIPIIGLSLLGAIIGILAPRRGLSTAPAKGIRWTKQG